jgi:hypothetical protein
VQVEVEITFSKSLPMGPGHNRAAAEALLREDPPEFDGMLLTLRSASNPRAAEIMESHIKANYQRELAESLPGDDAAGRAALLLAICGGVQLVRNVLHDPALTDGDIDRLIPHLEKALDAASEPD